MPRRSPIPMLVLIAAVLVGVGAARLAIGASELGLPTGPHAGWILRERMLRLSLGAVVGAALAVSGVALQALLRNPLAEPYILGLSTGAAAGMMVQWWLMYKVGVHLGLGGVGAVAGASASMLIVFAAGRRRGVIDPLGLLLTGVVLSTINGALVMGFNYLAGPGGIRDDLVRWMMGYLNESVSAAAVWGVAGLTAAGFVVLLSQGRAMDIATLSDAEAQSLGVNLGRLRVVLFAVSSVLAAGAVVLAGPIAFVGLICPHLARLMLGPSHRTLLIASAMLGAALVVAADVASAGLAMGLGVGIMPIGIFTALVGGVAFLWMLHPRLGRGMAGV